MSGVREGGRENVNVNVNVKKGGSRWRRVCRWVMVLVSAVLGVVWMWQGEKPAVMEWSWVGVRVQRGDVTVTKGDREARRALAQWDGAASSLSSSGGGGVWGGPTVGGVGGAGWAGGPWKDERSWTWRRPHPQLCPYPVHTVVVPLWPLVVVSLVVLGVCWWPRGRGKKGFGVGGRRRVFAGVALSAAGVALLGLWVWSGLGEVRVNAAPLRMTAQGGIVEGRLPDDPNDRVGFWLSRRVNVQTGRASSWNWWEWQWIRSASSRVRGFIAPAWPAAVVLCAAGAWLVVAGVRAGRLGREGHCGLCGYDVRGLSDGAVCPECGERERAK